MPAGIPGNGPGASGLLGLTEVTSNAGAGAFCASSETPPSAATIARTTAAAILFMSFSGLRGRSRRVDALPQVPGTQLVAAVGLQVEEQLRAIRRVSAQHQVDDERALGDFAAVKAGHFGAEVGVGHLAEHLRIEIAQIGRASCRERGWSSRVGG